MPSDDLRLNSLDAFTKKSPRLILEEHGGCEVPAGCGGVVLRWINPAAGLPVLLDFFHPTPATLAIDGVTTTTTYLLLAPGRHVLSLEFADPPSDGEALLVLVGVLKIAADSYPKKVVLRTAADGSWLFTASMPPAGWMTDPDLPRRGWKPLVRRPVVAERHRDAYGLTRALERGGKPIGIPPSPHGVPIRVRKVFVVPEVTPR